MGKKGRARGRGGRGRREPQETQEPQPGQQPQQQVQQQQPQQTSPQPAPPPQSVWAQRQQQDTSGVPGGLASASPTQNVWAQRQENQQQQQQQNLPQGATSPASAPAPGNVWGQPQQQISPSQTAPQADPPVKRLGRGRGRGVPPAAPGPQQATPSHAPSGSGVGSGDAHGGARPKQGAAYGGSQPDTGEIVEGVRTMTVSTQRRMPYDRFKEHQYKDPDKTTKGTGGRPINLVTNFFEVTLMNRQLFQYHVDFNPPVENKRVQYALICSLSAIVGDERCVDGGILYLTRRLDQDPLVATAQRLMRDGSEATEVKLTFTFKGEVFKTSPQFMQIANLVLRTVMRRALAMKQIRDRHFYPNLAQKVQSARLEVIPGFEASIEKFELGPLLTLDKTHKIISMDTVYDRIENLAHNKRPSFYDDCYRELLGAIVLTRYNNKTYKVGDIDWKRTPKDTFTRRGEEISFLDYYAKEYNITIHNTQQPMLVSKPTERDRRRGDDENVLLVPELCVVTGLSESVRRNFNLMRDLAAYTRVGPQGRLEGLQHFTQDINKNEEAQKIMRPLGLQISASPVVVPARQIPGVHLAFGNQKRELVTDGDFSQKMRGVAMLGPVDMNRWVLIHTRRAAGPASDLASCLQKVGRALGMRIQEPERAELQGDRAEEYLRQIRQSLKPDVQMMVLVVPNERKDRYDAIKKCCCIDNPVASQVVRESTLKKNIMSIATKIAIQLNCKMGGEPWGIPLPGKPKMIIGIDTYHDSGNKKQSVGAMVASLNTQCTRYYSRTETHPRGSEMMQNLNVLFTGAVKKFYEVNRRLPEHIIVYRDGVGDSQLAATFQFESEQLFQAFDGMGFKPQLTFVVVKKRINTRLFQPQGKAVGNPGPGTVVDSHITKSEWYDFFLVSQSVRQGTLTPTSYNVVYDTGDLTPGQLQQCTYMMTHLYFNWQGTIRVPAQCQFAHKLAFLQGQSLHREFSHHLTDKLFYL